MIDLLVCVRVYRIAAVRQLCALGEPLVAKLQLPKALGAAAAVDRDRRFRYRMSSGANTATLPPAELGLIFSACLVICMTVIGEYATAAVDGGWAAGDRPLGVLEPDSDVV